jgi:hypothetical protein
MKIILRCFLALMLALGLAGSAWADKHVGSYGDSDGDGTTYKWDVYKSDDGSYWYLQTITDPDGTVWHSTGTINPDPTGSSGDTGIDQQGMKDKLLNLKNKGRGDAMEADEFWGSPIGKGVTAKGGGIVPKWNPPNAGKTHDFEGGKMGGLNPQEGSPGDQLKRKAKKGGGGGGDGKDDDGDDDDNEGAGRDDKWDGLPGPPELVNPNPDDSGAKRASGGSSGPTRVNTPTGGSQTKPQTPRAPMR